MAAAAARPISPATLAAVRRRIVRLVRRHGIVVDRSEAGGDTADRLALAAPTLAAIAGAPVVSSPFRLAWRHSGRSAEQSAGHAHFDLGRGLCG